MERFIIFDMLNTWYDWRSILTAKEVTPPEPKTNYVNLDGMSGSLDLSEALTGEITYNDRTFSASFWTDYGNRTDRERLLRDITAALHGRKVKIIDPDYPDHYFYGRVKIKSRKNIIPYAEYSIEATCEPWRYSINESIRTITVDSEDMSKIVITNNGVKTLCPFITVTGTINLTYGNVNTTLTDGVYKISDVKLYHGSNVIGVSGSGAITFTYREADL